MGVHTKEPGISVIRFIDLLGQILGYAVETEDPMFDGEAATPELDVAWRRHKDARFPIFIFEVESLAAKSSTDNAVKVFSRRTSRFEKPLFFFHIFLDASIGLGRIEYLKDALDKHNYDSYVFEQPGEQRRFIKDVLEQHMRLDTYFDLYRVLTLIGGNPVFNTSVVDTLRLLVEREYDSLPQSDFLLTLEALIVNTNNLVIREFYVPYLLSWLADEARVRQAYADPSARAYSTVIHIIIALLVAPDPDTDEHFNQLQTLEASWRPWRLWDSNFGLSQDHDIVLLSDFPIYLTLLCAGFRNSDRGRYFSSKLMMILQKITNFTVYNIHGLTWLLIAAQISRHQSAYEYARQTINANGGLPISLIATPSLYIMDDRLGDRTDSELVVPFEDWTDWIRPQFSSTTPELLPNLLDGLLILSDADTSRREIAAYCVRRSIST